MAQRLRHQRLHPPEHDYDGELEIIVTITETIPGAALDKRLRREQAEALLDLIAAHLSRVHSVPHPLAKKNPAISSVFQKINSGGTIWTH